MVAVAHGHDRRIHAEGTTPEADWCDWLARLDPPRLPTSMPGGRGTRLVVVSPHPDDEVLACGGLIAAHAERGGTVAIVAVSDGEASHRGDPAWTPERLSRVRCSERTRGLARLGVPRRSITRLGLPDGAVAAHRATLRDALRPLLHGADLVVSTWALDGHPDHDATGAVVERLCAERACPLWQAPVWMWHWSTPADARVPWSRLQAWPLSPQVLARKSLALAEHASQRLPRAGAAGPVLGPAILARAARCSEYFIV